METPTAFAPCVGMAAAVMLAATTTFAAPLDFPASARTVAERYEVFGSHNVPTGPYRQGDIKSVRAEGAVAQKAWRIEESALTTLQILTPLRDQLVETGYDILFECETRECGGFDFRFQTDVLPAPDMHVDLGNYRFLSAIREGGETPEYVSLMVSRSAQAGFVQVTHIGPDAAPVPQPISSTKEIAPESPTVSHDLPPIGMALKEEGVTILEDLVFATGSSRLGDADFQSLNELAAFLNADPNRRVVLVGHTDAMGALESNIALSKRRAEAVAERLVADHGVRPRQISSRGVGFLSPRASNKSEDGRMLNRRVEVVLTSIE